MEKMRIIKNTIYVVLIVTFSVLHASEFFNVQKYDSNVLFSEVFSYDENGNIVSDTDGNRYFYNNRNQMIKILDEETSKIKAIIN